ncbi:hypothetical protein [Curvibacter gracilis]|uniref:hypothetical protein n=1 Tax=Curvibacter gracilis TaxID=230310 RepID=UPI0004823BF8|nr:hypothetical protein [Curvibacter gracilis]
MRPIQILEQSEANEGDQVVLSNVTYRDSAPFSGVFNLTFYDHLPDQRAPFYQTSQEGPWRVDVFCKVEGECVDDETIITLQLTQYPFVTHIVPGSGLEAVRKIGWVA